MAGKACALIGRAVSMRRAAGAVSACPMGASFLRRRTGSEIGRASHYEQFVRRRRGPARDRRAFNLTRAADDRWERPSSQRCIGQERQAEGERRRRAAVRACRLGAKIIPFLTEASPRPSQGKAMSRPVIFSERADERPSAIRRPDRRL